VRHHQIEQGQIGLELSVQGEHLPGIHGASGLAVAGVPQHVIQEPYVRWLIVDDEDPGLGGNSRAVWKRPTSSVIRKHIPSANGAISATRPAFISNRH